jgi:hypothetical protein
MRRKLLISFKNSLGKFMFHGIHSILLIIGLISKDNVAPQWVIGKNLRLYNSLTEMFALLARSELDNKTKAIILKMFSEAKSGQWQEAVIQASYDGPNAGDGRIELRATSLYTKVTLTERGKTVDYIAIYYLGVSLSIMASFLH